MNTNRSSYSLGAALGSAIVLALCAPAMAADIYDGGLKGGYDVPPPPSDRGIYIKGYVGQANPDVGNIWTEDYATNSFNVYNKDIKSSPLYGIGVGWQARHWLRFDLTGEYRGDAIFVGADRYPGVGFTAGTNEYTADIKSWLGLANAYIDMGNWCGFTPYIGAGIGFVYNDIERSYRNVDTEVDGGGVPTGATQTFTGSSKDTHVGLAAALMAGVTFAFDHKWAIDVNYRALFLDGGSVTATLNTPTPTVSKATLDDHWEHQVRVGLRFNIW